MPGAAMRPGQSTPLTLKRLPPLRIIDPRYGSSSTVLHASGSDRATAVGVARATLHAASALPNSLQDEFEALAAEWHAHTDHLSVVWQKEAHRTFRYIIGMGMAAVPFIIRDLRQTHGWWFGALEAIARNPDVAAGAASWDEAVAAWERWAQDRGLILSGATAP